MFSRRKRKLHTMESEQTFFDFSANDLKSGEKVEFSKYKGKVVLAINLATL